MSSIMKGLVNEKQPESEEDDIFRDRINDFDPEEVIDPEEEEVDEGIVDKVVVGTAKYAVPAITRSLPAIAKAGAKVGAKLGTRAGVGVAKKLGTSAMSAGRLGKKLGGVVGQYAAPAAAVSAANRLAAAAANRNQDNSAEDFELNESVIARYGLTLINKKKNSYEIEHAGNMSNTIENSVKPNVDKMLGNGAFDYMQKAGKEEGSADYLYTLTVPKQDFDYWVKSQMSSGVKQIDEISAKTLATAAHLASDPDSDYSYDKPHDASKFAKHATKKFGAKIGSQIAKAASGAGHFPKEYGTSGKQAPYHGRDKLADRTPSRVTSAGKANKQDVSALKNKIKNEEVKLTREGVDQAKQRDIKQQMLVSSILTRVQGFLHDNKRSVDHKQFITDLQRKLDSLKFSGEQEAEQIYEISKDMATRYMKQIERQPGLDSDHPDKRKPSRFGSQKVGYERAFNKASPYGKHRVKVPATEGVELDESYGLKMIYRHEKVTKLPNWAGRYPHLPIKIGDEVHRFEDNTVKWKHPTMGWVNYGLPKSYSKPTGKDSELNESDEQTAPVAETSIDQNPRSFIIYDKSSKKILQIDVMPRDLPLAVQYAQNAGHDAGYIRQKPSHFKGEYLDEQSNDRNERLRAALAKIKQDFENPPADHVPSKSVDAPKPEPKSVGGGMPYYPDNNGGRRYMGDSVEQVDELDAKTLISYKSKAQNELNKGIKDLTSRRLAKDVDTKTMKKRADGIKMAHMKLAEGTMTHGIFDKDSRKATMALQGLKSVMRNALPASQAADILHRYLFDDELFDLIDSLALRKHDADIRTDREIMDRINYLYREAKNDIATESIKKVEEGFTLKKLSLDKYVSPGNADDYAPDLKVKNTSYEIVHNKTGKVVGHAELKSDDYFGHGNLWIRMNNGAERYVDLKGMDPQAAINKFIKNPKTSTKYTQIAETSKDPILSKWRNSVVRRIKRASPEDQKILNSRLQKAKTASDFEQIHITLDKLGVRDELTQIDESKSYFTVQSLVQKFYEENNIDSRSQYLEIKHPGMRVWTRGDGRRYREPGVIRDDSEGKDGGKQLQAFWKWLVKLPGVKHLGKVSGEFGSSPFDDAYVYGGLYFSLSTYGIIKWGSKSRLRNSSIWRKTAEQQESVSENREDLELYGLHVGDTVRANINGKKVQGSVIDIFPQSMEIELLLSGPNAGKTVTVDVRQTENLGEEQMKKGTIHSRAGVVYSPKGEAIGEVYKNKDGWVSYHYGTDAGYDCQDSKEEAIDALHDLHQQSLSWSMNRGKKVNEDSGSLDPETALRQARGITRAIKYVDDPLKIIGNIQLLAERVPGIDLQTLKYSEDKVHEAQTALESAVYGLEEAFEDLLTQSQNSEEELDESKCWPGYKKEGTKMKGDVRVNNCVPTKESSILKGLRK